MKKIIFLLSLSIALVSAAQEMKRDPAVVRKYIVETVGAETIKRIQGHEGGKDFLKSFFADANWMEQFAGSGPWSNSPLKGLKEEKQYAAKALEALDLLVWNDKDDFISTKIGRNIATALALNHGFDWDEEKLVLTMECYREWAKNYSLHADAWKHDVRQWREVLGFGQNASLSVDDLRWIHDFGNVPGPRYYSACWQCAYRTFNCFGDSVQGPMYYTPWAHRWKTQELRYRVGGVCGALSKFGSHCAAAHGVRTFTAGQPGHCAYMLWDYTVGRWGTAYSVTGHTNPHNTLGGQTFPAIEEQERYFTNPDRMKAEYLRWQGKYEASMKACPGNWCAAIAWYNQLEAKKDATPAEWDAYGAAVRKTFATAPSQGWQLYLPYLEKIANRDARLDAARKGLLDMRESEEPTYEPPYLDELCLKKLDRMFPKDPEAVWRIFESVLEGQAKTKTFFRQAIAWGSERLMTGEADSRRFIDTVAKSAERSGERIDLKGMLLKASQSGDIAMFKQVSGLLDKFAPDSVPKKTARSWPVDCYGGKLLSGDGMLMTSSTSRWDDPTTYRNVLTPYGFAAGNGFHTAKEKAPWGMVKLPGASVLSGVTVVNSGHSGNERRQAPLRIWVSSDGKSFREVFASDQAQGEWTCKFASPVTAQYVKVGRDPAADKDEVFHLYKILVYGKKLY